MKKVNNDEKQKINNPSSDNWKNINELPINVYNAYIKDVEDTKIEEKYSYRKRMNLPLDDISSKNMLKHNRKKLREICVKHGLDTFDDTDVLELILTYSLPCQDTREIARRLIMSFGSLKAVLNADYESLLEFDGISDASASQLILFREVGKYINTKGYGDKYLSTSELTGRFCCEYFKNHVEENFIMITLGPNSVIVAVDVISSGSESETSLNIRRVVKRALQHRATRVVLAHNHPMDVCKPSNSDIVATGNVCSVLNSLGITVSDHIICNDDKYYSMSDRGVVGSNNG